MGEPLTLQMVGDLILDEPNPDALFDLARHQLHACDVLVGHVEVPHTARGVETHFDVPAPASDPAQSRCPPACGIPRGDVGRQSHRGRRTEWSGGHDRRTPPPGHRDHGRGHESDRGQAAGDCRTARTAPGISQLQLCGTARVLGRKRSSWLRLCTCPDALRTGPCISGRSTHGIHVCRTQTRSRPWRPISKRSGRKSTF